MRRILYRLFFTRDDDMDLLQVVFLAWVLFTGLALWKLGTAAWHWPVAAYTLCGSVFATLAICGTPTWIAKLLAESRNTAAVVDAIARAPAEPDLWRDDERGK